MIKPSRVQPNWIFNATVIEVHDGDTARVRCDQGFDQDGAKVWVRMSACYAPELNQPGGQEAHARLTSLIPVGSRVVVVTEQVKTRDRETAFRRSFVRYVATIYRDDPATGEQQDVAKILVDEGHAVAYAGHGPRLNP